VCREIVLGGADSSLYDMDCNVVKMTDGLLQDKDCIEKFFFETRKGYKYFINEDCHRGSCSTIQ
jgi:hypothetical protein